MALLQSEIEEIRFELGYNVLTVGAEPYISYVAVFDQVIAAFLQAGATTTSSTAVSAAVGGPAAVALTLANATGFVAGDQVVIDVDVLQEQATIQTISGSSITVLLVAAHSGTYPVTQQGGETIVRQQLVAIRLVKKDLLTSRVTAGIAKADEATFFPFKNRGSSRLRELERARTYYRGELASALGVPNLWRIRQGAGAAGGPVLY